jgi:TonB family protein
VQAWIDAAGDVAFSSVLESGGPEFDASAERAVRRSTFEPARLAGARVASRVALRIHFQLYD